MIYGIIMQYGENDYSLWEGFRLTAKEENAVSNILMMHGAEGYSVRGTLKEIAKELEQCS